MNLKSMLDGREDPGLKERGLSYVRDGRKVNVSREDSSVKSSGLGYRQL